MIWGLLGITASYVGMWWALRKDWVFAGGGINAEYLRCNRSTRGKAHIWLLSPIMVVWWGCLVTLTLIERSLEVRK